MDGGGNVLPKARNGTGYLPHNTAALDGTSLIRCSLKRANELVSLPIAQGGVLLDKSTPYVCIRV